MESKMTPQELITWLEEKDFTFSHHNHEPVFTVEQAQKLDLPVAGASKNLFIRNDKGNRHYLVVLAEDTNVDLKKLAATIGIKRLSFASKERLKKYLAIEPGSVSVLALINDTDHSVEVYIDAVLMENNCINAHPLTNSQTCILSFDQVERFLAMTGHTFTIIAKDTLG